MDEVSDAKSSAVDEISYAKSTAISEISIHIEELNKLVACAQGAKSDVDVVVEDITRLHAECSDYVDCIKSDAELCRTLYDSCISIFNDCEVD